MDSDGVAGVTGDSVTVPPLYGRLLTPTLPVDGVGLDLSAQGGWDGSCGTG